MAWVCLLGGKLTAILPVLRLQFKGFIVAELRGNKLMAEKKPRPGEKNLIPINERTVEEQRLMRHNGGKASGVARRKKKQLRQIMLDLLAKDVMDTKQLRKVANMGYDEDEIDNATLLVVCLFKRACLGDVSAIKEVRNLIGEDTSADVMRKLDDILLGVEAQINDPPDS